jgi:hypothetical protein
MGVFNADIVNMATQVVTPPASAGAADAATTGGDQGKDAGKGKAADEKQTPAGATPEVDALLDKYGLTSIQELDEFLDRGTKVVETIGDANPEDLVEDSKALKQYRQKVAAEERRKAKENETPEQTIARLEAELTERESRQTKAERARQKAAESQQNLDSYYSFVGTLIDGEKDLTEPEKQIAAAIMGIKSPVNAHDITDRKVSKRLLKDFAIKITKEASAAIIKHYEDAKKNPPPVVPDPNRGVPPTEPDPSGPKNLTEARGMAHSLARQTLGALLGRK